MKKTVFYLFGAILFYGSASFAMCAPGYAWNSCMRQCSSLGQTRGMDTADCFRPGDVGPGLIGVKRFGVSFDGNADESNFQNAAGGNSHLEDAVYTPPPPPVDEGQDI